MGAHAAPKGKAGRPRRAELDRERALRARSKGSLAARVFVGYWALYLAIIISSGMSNHLTIGFYLYSVLFWIMLPVAGVTAIVLAERAAAASTYEPPRWSYLLLTLCYLSPAAIAGVAAIRLGGKRPSWWPDRPLEQAVTMLFALGLTWMALLALMAIGRAALNGRLRERCWLCPPQWLLTDRRLGYAA